MFVFLITNKIWFIDENKSNWSSQNLSKNSISLKLRSLNSKEQKHTSVKSEYSEDSIDPNIKIKTDRIEINAKNKPNFKSDRVSIQWFLIRISAIIWNF